MAIKGKKKSKGSAGARRPAGAPRPQIPATRRKHSFWRTRDGILIIAVFAVVGIGAVVWLVAEARSDAAARQERATAVEQFTDGLDPVLTDVDDEVAAMMAVQSLPPEDEIPALAKDAQEWMQALQNAQLLIQQRFPAPEVESVSQLFNEGYALYINAASLLAGLDGIEGLSDRHRDALFQNFATQRDLARSVLQSTIATLDQLRSELGLGRSGLQAPGGSAPMQASPSPQADQTITVPPEDVEEDSGSDEDAGEGNNG